MVVDVGGGQRLKSKKMSMDRWAMSHNVLKLR